MTDTNDYLDAIDSIEITPKMQQAIDDVIGLIDNRMAGLDNNGERMVTGVQIAAIIAAASLANGLRDYRHLLNPAIEMLAEGITESAEKMFEAFDDGLLATH